MIKTKLIYASIMILSATAIAADKPWKDTAELSYVQTSGNSKTSTISAKNLFNYDWSKAALEVVAGGLGTKSDESVTAEQYNASEKVSWKMTGKNYAFEKLTWDKNRFAGFKDRWDLGIGLGRYLMQSEYNQLFAELGFGYIWEDRLHGTENQTFGTYRAYSKYIRTLSSTANVSQDFEYLGNLKESDGYRINTETAMITSISSHFSLKASHIWKFVNSPTAGFKKTDTMNMVSIIVNY